MEDNGAPVIDLDAAPPTMPVAVPARWASSAPAQSPTPCSTNTCETSERRTGTDDQAQRLRRPGRLGPHRPARRANVERHSQGAVEIVAYKLAELRKLRAITQTELARTLGVAQPSISNVERGDDALLSTLRSYVEALGGRLEVAAIFDGDRIRRRLTNSPASGGPRGQRPRVPG